MSEQNEKPSAGGGGAGSDQDQAQARSLWVGLGVLLAVISVVALIRFRSPGPGGPAPSISSESLGLPQAQSSVNPPSLQASSAHALPFHPPSGKTLRDQVRENPHHPPRALLQFADQLAAEMEESKASPARAVRLFENLSSCVTAPEGRDSPPPPPQVQALCLNNAQRLGELYPESLKSNYLSLEKAANPETIRLRDALRQLQTPRS